MPRRQRAPRTASAVFQKLWDELDAIREKKAIDPDAIAKKCGFSRSTWFVYQDRGTIPFNLLERIAHQLGASVQAGVITKMSGAAGNSEKTEDQMTYYLEAILKLVNDLPEDQRDFAAGAVYTAAKEALRALPFAEPVAEHTRASRGRSK